MISFRMMILPESSIPSAPNTSFAGPTAAVTACKNTVETKLVKCSLRVTTNGRYSVTRRREVARFSVQLNTHIRT